ncbi:glucose-1-phosphate thymidylyltransferase [Lipingzhangella halophila]|uniref:Glucose-1-phosphate thymidylyltransferase n=1 Tax=Lipingzhangella halophila TaxID=1783352 RepID=A0A7W7RM44_9ACTN|nr:glucose-1-phosphate thymidylyltransferase [Lipingzhangella halophila]
MLPVADRPVLLHILDRIREAGVTDVGIIAGENMDQISSILGNGNDIGLQLTYLHQEKPLGLAHAVITAQDFLDRDPFLMFLGDIFLDGHIMKETQRFREDPEVSRILLTHVSDPRELGVVELDDNGRPTRLREKPGRPTSNVVLTGIYFFSEAMHQAVWSISPGDRGELEITDAIQWLIDRGHPVEADMVDGGWKDTGNPSDLLDVNRRELRKLHGEIHGDVDTASSLHGEVRIAEGSTVIRSRIHGPVTIGHNCVITDSTIGPFTSVSEGSRITSASVENSIVLAHATVHGVGDISASLIGRHAEVRRASSSTTKHTFVIGDHSGAEVRG